MRPRVIYWKLRSGVVLFKILGERKEHSANIHTEKIYTGNYEVPYGTTDYSTDGRTWIDIARLPEEWGLKGNDRVTEPSGNIPMPR